MYVHVHRDTFVSQYLYSSLYFTLLPLVRVVTVIELTNTGTLLLNQL